MRSTYVILFICLFSNMLYCVFADQFWCNKLRFEKYLHGFLLEAKLTVHANPSSCDFILLPLSNLLTPIQLSMLGSARRKKSLNVEAL